MKKSAETWPRLSTWAKNLFHIRQDLTPWLTDTSKIKRQKRVKYPYWRSTQDTDRAGSLFPKGSKTKDQSVERSHLVIRISLTVRRLYPHNPIQSLSSDWSINDSNIYLNADISVTDW